MGNPEIVIGVAVVEEDVIAVETEGAMEAEVIVVEVEEETTAAVVGEGNEYFIRIHIKRCTLHLGILINY